MDGWMNEAVPLLLLLLLVVVVVVPLAGCCVP
jgi:hypothetical protein